MINSKLLFSPKLWAGEIMQRQRAQFHPPLYLCKPEIAHSVCTKSLPSDFFWPFPGLFYRGHSCSTGLLWTPGPPEDPVHASPSHLDQLNWTPALTALGASFLGFKVTWSPSTGLMMYQVMHWFESPWMKALWTQLPARDRICFSRVQILQSIMVIIVFLLLMCLEK